MHLGQGNFSEATLLLKDVLATRRSVLGAGHLLDTRLAAKNLAITYSTMGTDAEAAELWARGAAHHGAI